MPLSGISTMRTNPSPIPFFILGHARSGTTALAAMANSLPNVACLYQEGNILCRLWQSLQQRDICEESIKLIICDFKTTAHHNLIRRAPKTKGNTVLFQVESIENICETLKHSLKKSEKPHQVLKHVSQHFFTIYGRQTNCAIVGDKVPDFLFIPDHITKASPRSKIINITRDPRAVIHSSLLFNKETLHLFAVPSAFAMAVSYQIKQRTLKQFLKTFPKSEQLTLSQEELLLSPERVLQQLTTFFDQPLPSPKSRCLQPNRTKQWWQEMSFEDQHAINAVNHVFEQIPLTDHLPRQWINKAQAILPLLFCPNKEIFSYHDNLNILFKTIEEKTDLGLSLQQLADHAYRRSNFQRAKTFFSLACLYMPTSPTLWYKYGCLCYDMKLLSETQRCINRCHETCPSNNYYSFLKAKNHLLHGKLEILRNHLPKAKELLEKSIQIKPDFSLPQEILEIQH